MSSDRPDIFNSVALSIGRSPLDARWNQVSGAGVGGDAGAFAASLRGEGIIAKLEAVNGYVNARVRFVDDRIQFGVADRWMPASETLARGRGDCEDFALAKRAMLRAAGVPDKDLYLVVLKDLTPPRRPCRAGGPRRRPLPGARQWHRPDRRFERRRRITSRC